ncbi:uncharacterized protein AAEQ78_000437 isoform 4-T12 [Lycaon pictus]|uniref:uncharacterized protein isoform X12 n=1 Tax=Canis lupus baileyi TaxID=143281 RepID=UPI003B9744E8
MNLDNISVVEIIWAPEQLIQKDKTFTRCNLTAQKMNKCFPNFVLVATNGTRQRHMIQMQIIHCWLEAHEHSHLEARGEERLIESI